MSAGYLRAGVSMRKGFILLLFWVFGGMVARREGKAGDIGWRNKNRKKKERIGIERAHEHIPGGSPGYLPKPPMICCVFSRKLRLAWKSIRWTLERI